MALSNWLWFLGGLAIFLYGMHTMGASLSAIGGGKLETFLGRITSNPIKAVIVGAGITALIHSSGATTVMVVGFVNSSLMTLEQASGVIMGANVGTTVTSWILSLTGLSGDNFFINLLKPATFAPVFAIIGVVIATIIKRGEKSKTLGMAIFGFGILMMGMELMTDSVSPLANDPRFIELFAALSNPVLGLLVGIGFTAAVQSSTASVGILQAIILTGGVSYGSVLPIVMGQNIGTCITALISSIGTNKNAKRAAFMHLYFNCIGTGLFMVVFYTINAFHPLALLNSPASVMGIAVFHTVFNLVTTGILLPNRKMLVKLACATVRSDAKEIEEETNAGNQKKVLARLDERFLSNPGVALEQSKVVAAEMARTAHESMKLAIGLLWKWDEEAADKVIMMENQADEYEDKLGSYLLKLGAKDLNTHESDQLGLFLHSIGDFERISDHATNLLESAKEMHDKNEQFTPHISREMRVFCDSVTEIMDLAFTAFENNDVSLAEKVEPLEEVVDNLSLQMKERRINYLSSGQCSMLTSFILSDLNIYLERVSDHCSNIAVTLIEVGKESFDMHEYLDTVKGVNSEEFQNEFREYANRFKLPEPAVVYKEGTADTMEDKIKNSED